jgi:flavin reductase (DIM6/NTAB) family NADH-FMN oxidoreductase RutF
MAKPNRSVTNSNPVQLDSRRFREIAGNFASGVVVVTSTHEELPVGVTCQSFYSVSLEPAMVSFSVSASSKTYPTIKKAGHFCINILGAHQTDVSAQFAVSDTDKWKGVSWHKSDEGNPIIEGAIGWLECIIEHELLAGDHYIVVGRVSKIRENASAKGPLVYFRGKYRRLHDTLDSNSQAFGGVK